jgi:tripartite-type tricarboxylate transporter receptor subunit TctC
VRIVVAVSAGSQSDILARAMSEEFAKRWGREVIVENRPGLAGTASVAKSAPDGHTLLLASNGHAMIRSLNRNLNFDPIEDFVAVTKVAALSGVFVVSPENGPKSLSELIATAKANPGKLNYASAGLGSASSIGVELLKSVAGIDLVHVPHKGIPDAHVSVMRGDTALFMTFYSAAASLIASGKLRAIAVVGQKRLSALPDLPTVQEAGVPTFSYEAWFGFLAPKGTPRSIVETVNATTAEVIKLDTIGGRFGKLGVDLATTTPEAFDTLLRSDSARFVKIFGRAEDKPAAAK